MDAQVAYVKQRLHTYPQPMRHYFMRRHRRCNGGNWS
jgi:hypothetical protein